MSDATKVVFKHSNLRDVTKSEITVKNSSRLRGVMSAAHAQNTYD